MMPADILINGGGIAGPCLAYWLTRHGHAVTITEQARELRTGGQAVDFRGPSLEVLEQMGLLEQVRTSATNMGPLILVDGRGNEVGRLPAEVISGELEIFWGDLAGILHEAVRDDVDFRFGVRVTALADHGHQIEASFSDGSTGSYDLVFGADGLHSAVRHLVFGPEEQYVTQLGQVFGFFDIENRQRLDHRGMACTLPGRTAVLQATDPAKPARASFYLTDRMASSSTTETPKATSGCSPSASAGIGWEVPNFFRRRWRRLDPVYFDSIAQVHLDSYARGRVCLIGDAAWCSSPRSGMGTSLAVVGAYVLANEMRYGWRRLQDGFRQISAAACALCRAVPEARRRQSEDGQLLVGLGRPGAKHRPPDCCASRPCATWLSDSHWPSDGPSSCRAID